MSDRKRRPEAEGTGHRVPPEGPEVFAPSKDRSGCSRIEGIIGLDGQPKGWFVRWPAGTARRGPPDPPVVPEVIYMADKPLTRITYPDPYLQAEERVAERQRLADQNG